MNPRPPEIAPPPPLTEAERLAIKAYAEAHPIVFATEDKSGLPDIKISFLEEAA